MAADLLRRWRKDRDKAVASLNVDKFIKFYKKWQMLGAYEIKQMPPRNIVEITMYKMALEIKGIPADVQERACKWLVKHGYFPGIKWNEEGRENGTDQQNETN